ANFAGFAPTKAAQRILAEAMARDLGPKGVHVAYIVIDAVIDVPWARERFKTKPDDFFIAPTAIADEAWHVANQPRSAWSFNVEVRPYGETWYLSMQTCSIATLPVAGQPCPRRVPSRSAATNLPLIHENKWTARHERHH